MGRGGTTCDICGMGMGRDAGILLDNGHHMGIHNNWDGMGWDYWVIGGWRDAPGKCGIPTWDPVWDHTGQTIYSVRGTCAGVCSLWPRASNSLNNQP